MLEAKNLKKSFGKTEAVSDVSLEVNKGEVVGILGPNGAGKTTTMQMLSGLMEPDSGVVQAENPVRESVSVVFQEVDYSSKLKVREFLRLMAVLNERLENFEEVIESLGLEEYKNTMVTDLSGGNKKKVNIASGLLKDPEYLLLDEPTAGLDPRARKDVRDIISDFAEDTGILVSTHSMEEAEKLCDEVFIVEDGEVVVSGSPDDLISGIQGDFIVKAEGEVPENLDYEFVKGERFFEVKTDRPHELIKDFVERSLLEDLENLSVEKPGLEQVFFEVTGRRYEEGN